MRRNVQRPVNLAIAKDAQTILRKPADEALFEELLRTHFGVFLKLLEIADVDGRKLFLENSVRKAALRHTPMQRHLSTFKAALLAASRAGPHAVMSASGRLSVARARPTSD